MSNRKKDCPYRELGRILEDWRVSRFRSVLAMFREAHLSFSYYTYADYERGALLPSVSDIMELAKYFKVDERPALLRWAEVQMPTTRLKILFLQAGRGISPGPLQAGPHEATEKQTSPSFENTWVFGTPEQESIRKLPWFFELCQRLAFVHPKGLSHRELGLKKQADLENLIREHLQPWIAQGRMLFRDKRLHLASPHVHLPKAGSWQEVRKINLQRAIDKMSETINNNVIQGQQAYREIITRTLSEEQIVSWAQRLHELEAEFKAMSYLEEAGDKSSKVYSYISIFGERILSGMNA